MPSATRAVWRERRSIGVVGVWGVLLAVGDWCECGSWFVRPVARLVGDVAWPPCALADERGQGGDEQGGDDERGEHDSDGHAEPGLLSGVVVVDHERAERGG